MGLIAFSCIVAVKVTVNSLGGGGVGCYLLVSPYLSFPYRPLNASAFKSPG